MNKFTFEKASFIGAKDRKLEEDYKIQKVLGEGAFSIVYKAVNKKSKQVRCIKKIKTDAFSKAEGENIMNEIKMLTKIDHPYIMKIVEYYEKGEFLYIVTEFLEGGELFDKISQDTSFSEADAARYIGQILMAVSYLHSKNIVHRDLKPENIVLDSAKPRQNIKIIDFGTSREIDAKERLRTKVGTAYYIAPEVLDMDYDNKCDIWSCGIILYVLLCGYPPFNGATEEKIVERIKKGKFGFPAEEWDHISPNAKDIIKSMLTLDPKKRPTADQILQEPWFDELQQSTVDISVKSNVIANLKSFKSKIRLQKAVFLYFVNFFDLKKQRQQLLTVFKSMDKDHDGRLSYNEILEAYAQIYDQESAKQYVDNIFEVLDFNKSAELEFSEFMVANVDYAKNLNNKRLKQLFDIIDVDSSGNISQAELKKFLNIKDPDQDDLVKEIIKEVDSNGDGVRSYDEFLAMMDGFYKMI